MGKIYKYELIRRKNSMIILLGIMAGMTLVSMFITAFFGHGQNIDLTRSNLPFAAVSWVVLTSIALFGIPVFMMFSCSSGHAKELLYKDTNYLMLSIPVKSWKILLGRFLVGLTEIVIYSLASFILGSLWLIVIVIKGGEDLSQFINVLLLNVGKNMTLILVIIFSVLTFITLFGTVVMFVRILTRSFIKRKKLAELVSLVLFVLLFVLVSNLMSEISSNLDWIVHIKTNFYSITKNGIMQTTTGGSVPIPILLPVGYGILSTIFFIISAWLLKHKVEV